jgi:hypothetical protein
MGRGRRDESLGLKLRRQDVAAAAAANQNLAAAVGRPFTHYDRTAAAARENRGHEAGRAGADDDDWRIASPPRAGDVLGRRA